MYTNPKENRTYSTCILIEQFRRKGYQCEEIRKEEATILILRHGKKTDAISPIINETYKNLRREN